jgi:hypothetical protein
MVRILRRSAAYKVAARRHAPYSELPSDHFDRRCEKLLHEGATNREKKGLTETIPYKVL